MYALKITHTCVKYHGVFVTMAVAAVDIVKEYDMAS